MKLLKILSAGVVAAAVAATMVFSASAATKEDVLKAAKDAGLSSETTQYQHLENFLETNEFTSEEYDQMIAVANDASEKYIKAKAAELFPDKALSELTADDLSQIVAAMTAEEKQAIRDALAGLADDLGVKIEIGVDDATASKGDNTTGGDVITPPVADTGAVETTNTAAVAFVGFAALALASAGVVVISKKSK